MRFRNLLVISAVLGSSILVSACGDCSNTQIRDNNGKVTDALVRAGKVVQNTKAINDCLTQPDPKAAPKPAPAGPPCGCACT